MTKITVTKVRKNGELNSTLKHAQRERTKKQTKSKLTYCAIHCKISNSRLYPVVGIPLIAVGLSFSWTFTLFVELSKASLVLRACIPRSLYAF